MQYVKRINFRPNTMKKTIEEAAEEYADNYFIMQDNHYSGLMQGFKAGAKYQSEQMYSERIKPDHIFLVTDETHKKVRSANYDFESAKAECNKLEGIFPYNIFMIVELKIN